MHSCVLPGFWDLWDEATYANKDNDDPTDFVKYGLPTWALDVLQSGMDVIPAWVYKILEVDLPCGSRPPPSEAHRLRPSRLRRHQKHTRVKSDADSVELEPPT
jgi:hypothetical protein